jgi:hypothetical protein
MDITRVHKKIAEATFFLGKMAEQECQFFGDREPFDYYLSAFLSAGRTVDYRLRHEQSAIYPDWRKTWDAALSPTEKRLIKFMVDERNDEVHESGSSHCVGQEGVPLPSGTSSLDGATIFISNPPGEPPPIAYRPTYSFTIDGTERKAVDACAQYLGLLKQMVGKFEADRAPEQGT